MAARKTKAEQKQDYEILTPIDFGGVRDEFGDLKPEDEQKQDLWGVHHPTPQGEDNPVVSLTERQAGPLLEAGAIKPAGEESPKNTDNPEKYGYAGQKAREEAQKNDEVYTGGSSEGSEESDKDS